VDLFLYIGNSARSQMAMGLMMYLRRDEFKVYSAVIQPKGMHPHAIGVKKEIRIDISAQRSKRQSYY